MLRLLANRESKRRRQINSNKNGSRISTYADDEEHYEDANLDTSTYRDAWNDREAARVDAPPPVDTYALSPSESSSSSSFASASTSSSEVSDFYSVDNDDITDFSEDDDEPQYEGWGSAGFSSSDSVNRIGNRRDPEANGAGLRPNRGGKKWERVSGQPTPRRTVAPSRFERRHPRIPGGRSTNREGGRYGYDDETRASRTPSSDLAGRDNGRRP